MNFAEGGGMGTSLVAFETIDEGLILIDPLSHREVALEVGKSFFKLMGEPPQDFNDTIARIITIW